MSTLKKFKKLEDDNLVNIKDLSTREKVKYDLLLAVRHKEGDDEKASLCIDNLTIGELSVLQRLFFAKEKAIYNQSRKLGGIYGQYLN